jgi:hypothetical protein
MASIDITTQSGAVATGVLQLLNGVALDATLRSVTDQNNTASPLKLSTSLVQTTSTLRITTNDNPYIDAEDGTGNNRFTVGRDPLSQQVNVDFASNPTGSTTAVGAIRTYADGVNLSEAMTFREDGNVGINTNTPGAKLDVHSASNVVAQFNRTGTGKSWIQYLQAGTGRWNTGYDNTNGNFTIYDAVNSLDRLVVSNAGNVGIGTTTPISPLNIQSDTSNVGILSITTSGGGSDRLEVWNSNSVVTPVWNIGIPNPDTRIVMFSNITLRANGTTAAAFDSNQASFGSITGARVGIKGTGSTSATTSLLVQNSAGTELLKVRDDNRVLVENIIVNGFIGNINSGVVQIGGSGGTSPNAYFNAISESFGFGVSSINASAKLQIDSTTKGFLPPRMTNAQRAAIATPAVGLMVYCTDAVEGLYVYKSTGWTFVI